MVRRTWPRFEDFKKETGVMFYERDRGKGSKKGLLMTLALSGIGMIAATGAGAGGGCADCLDRSRVCRRTASFRQILSDGLVRRRFDQFNLDDEELYANTYRNRQARDAIGGLIPLFECPDEDIERTYYFRWWTYRKHLRRVKDGKGWAITEFLPDVCWAGAENTIACPFGHHVREGRWLRTSEYIDGYIDFMLEKGNVSGACAYLCWPAWAALECAKVTGGKSAWHLW